MTTAQQKRQANKAFSDWVRSQNRSLLDCYANPSHAKQRAWKYCQSLCTDYNGYNLKVISYNNFMFTAGFEYTKPETGECMFMYITPNYDQQIPFPVR